MSIFQSAPTESLPTVGEGIAETYNPVWTRWFIDLIKNLNSGGAGSGSVSSVATGTGLTGGPITTAGTISLVTATASVLGGVKPDGTSILNTAGAISVTPASVGAPSGSGTSTGANTGDNVEVAAQAIGFTITKGTTPKTLTVALDASVTGTNTGDNAANSTYTIGSQTQAHGAKLDSIQALADAAGYLHNDGAGTFAYSTPVTTVAPGLQAFLAAHG